MMIIFSCQLFIIIITIIIGGLFFASVALPSFHWAAYSRQGNELPFNHAYAIMTRIGDDDPPSTSRHLSPSILP